MTPPFRPPPTTPRPAVEPAGVPIGVGVRLALRRIDALVFADVSTLPEGPNTSSAGAHALELVDPGAALRDAKVRAIEELVAELTPNQLRILLDVLWARSLRKALEVRL